MKLTNEMVNEINEMIQAAGGELRVSRVKNTWACFYYSKVSEVADMLTDAGFEIFRNGAAYLVKGKVELVPESKPETASAAKTTGASVSEILAPLGNLDEKFDLESQMEISNIVETMRLRLNWRLCHLVKSTKLAPSTVKSWLNELRQYGIITVSLNARGQYPRYVFTRDIEDGACCCSPELHIAFPEIGGMPLWGNCQAQIKNRVRMFENCVDFATTQDVRFALGWLKEIFDTTLEELKRRSVLQIKNNIVSFLGETKNKDDPKTRKFQIALRACRVHPNDRSEFVDIATVLNRLGCRTRAWDDWISHLVNNRILELEHDPAINANHESRYRDYKCRLREGILQ